MMRKINTKLFDTINNIDKKDWDLLNKHQDDLFVSWDFCNILEKSNIKINYLLIYDNEEAIGKAIFSFIKLDLLEIAPLEKRKIIKLLLKVFNKNNKVAVMHVGIPIAFSESSLRVKNRDYYNLVVNELIKIFQKKFKSRILLFSFLDSIQVQQIQNKLLYKISFFFNYFLYNNFTSFNNYIENMKNKYSRHLLFIEKYIKKNKINYRSSTRFSSELYRLYSNIFYSSDYKFRKLTPHFFYNLLSDRNIKSSLVKIFKGENLIGFFIITESESRLYFNFYGAQSSINSKIKSPYFFVLNFLIKNSIKKGKNLYLGSTSDFVKMRYGSNQQKRFLLVNIKNKFFWLLIKLLKFNFKNKSQINVFKNPQIHRESY